MFESRTLELTDAGRVELTRSPTRGITAVVQVETIAVTTQVEPDGRVAVTIAQNGTTIWEYEMRALPRGLPPDVNAELRQQVAEVLVPPPRRGRPPKPPLPKKPGAPTLAELAARQGRPPGRA